MSQLNLYLPEALASEVRRRAKRLKLSVSKYVASVLERDGNKPGDDWGDAFFTQVAGQWQGELGREATETLEERADL